MQFLKIYKYLLNANCYYHKTTVKLSEKLIFKSIFKIQIFLFWYKVKHVGAVGKISALPGNPQPCHNLNISSTFLLA